MKNTLILLLSLLLNASCSNSGNNKSISNTIESSSTISSNIKNNITLNSQETDKSGTVVNNECKCFNGIGSSANDKPVKTFTFKNGVEVSICGYSESGNETIGLKISEFEIFDCKSGKSYVTFDAVENCFIKTSNDSIIVNLLDYLPNNSRWEWKSVIKAKQVITSKADSLNISQLIVCYKKTGYETKIAAEYLNNLEKGKEFDEEWEETIGRLKFLSLEGNSHAWEILKEYDKFTGFIPDGAMAEDWKDAIATVKWITDFK